MQARILRIGTRGSPLALAQAREVRGRLMVAHGRQEADFEIVVFKTSGDRIQDRPLSEAGGKGLFTKEIEDALLDGRIDLAVHSMKDVPTQLPDGLSIAALLPREDVRDAFISLKHRALADMPSGAVVGTSSLRRRAQVRHLRPDLAIVEFRGNVETRLRKLADGVAEATFLAMAGLNRLGLAHHITAVVETDTMLPAVAQGAVGIEIRAGNRDTAACVAALDDGDTRTCVDAERAFLQTLEGSCRTPIGGLARIVAGAIDFRGEILTPDGRTVHRTQRTGAAADAMRLAVDAAEDLLARAGPGFFTLLD